MPLVKNDLGKDDRQQGFESQPHISMAISSNIRTKIFALYWLPVILYCLLIFIQSSYPATQSLPSIPHMDKLTHAGAYALLGFLFFRAFQTTKVGKGAVLLVILSALASSLYGVSDEIHQYFVPSRTADILDVAANTAGSVLGAMTAKMILNRQ
jgi:VanZ family protein